MADDDEIDTRLLVNSSTDDDGVPNLRPWLSVKDDNPPDPDEDEPRVGRR